MPAGSKTSKTWSGRCVIGVAYSGYRRGRIYLSWTRLYHLSTTPSSAYRFSPPDLQYFDMPINTTPPTKTDAIVVVGAGIFGLSTVIHLAERGYTNVTLIDKQPYEKTLYSYFEGCDAASAGQLPSNAWHCEFSLTLSSRHQQDHPLSVWFPEALPGSQPRCD